MYDDICICRYRRMCISVTRGYIGMSFGTGDEWDVPTQHRTREDKTISG